MYRYLLVHTSAYTLPKYKKLKQLYQDNIKEAHKRFLRFKTKFVKKTTETGYTNNSNTDIFYVNLIGFDGTIKYSFTKVNKSTFKTIFDKIDAMPLGNLRPGNNKTKKRNTVKINTIRNANKTEKNNKNVKPKGLSLYADYNPKTTLKGTGFKDEETAKRTLELIANRELTYQKQVVNTMYNRAKFHPNQTSDMRKAMRVYNKWLLKHK